MLALAVATALLCPLLPDAPHRRSLRGNLIAASGALNPLRSSGGHDAELSARQAGRKFALLSTCSPAGRTANSNYQFEGENFFHGGDIVHPDLAKEWSILTSPPEKPGCADSEHSISPMWSMLRTMAKL